MLNGLVDPEFAPVARLLRSQVRSAGGGAAACVYFRGKKVVDTWAGVRDAEGRPWEADTLSISFSTTKGVTATALHILADRGLVDYDAPVARYWPEFAQNGKAAITLRQVLTHRAGLYHVRGLIDDGRTMTNWDAMVRALERATPIHEPGAYPAYHGLTYGWLVGEVVRRVSGVDFSDFVRDEIARPLGLDGLHIGAPAEALERAAVLTPPSAALESAAQGDGIGRWVGRVGRLIGYPIDLRATRDALTTRQGGDVFWDPDVVQATIPAANGLFSARSLARLYAALAAGGGLDGVRILSEETLAKATEVQTKQRDRVLVIRPYWRLGWHGVLTTRGRLSQGFGHFGFGGSGAWACPKRQLAVAMTNNRAGGTALGDLRILQLGAEALLCARAARSRRAAAVEKLEDSRSANPGAASGSA